MAHGRATLSAEIWEFQLANREKRHPAGFGPVYRNLDAEMSRPRLAKPGISEAQRTITGVDTVEINRALDLHCRSLVIRRPQAKSRTATISVPRVPNAAIYSSYLQSSPFSTQLWSLGPII